MSSQGLSLVADIGGTNTRVALAEGTSLRLSSIRRFRNAEHPDLHSILRDYLAEVGRPDVSGVCVAAAGPVRDGAARMTNLDWELRQESLSRATGADRAIILNDLQAQGHALGHLDPGALHPVIKAPAAREGAPELIIGIGTGFNAAPVHHVSGGRLVAASECGHATLPARTEDELHLGRYAAHAGDFTSIEDLLSGPGLARLDAWRVTTEDAAPRHPADIMKAAAVGEARARAALDVFVPLLGRVAGDLALIHLPTGGIWLVGGVARAVGPYLARSGFAEAFVDKGRFSDFMQQFRVTLITDDYAALAGCASALGAAQ